MIGVQWIIVTPASDLPPWVPQWAKVALFCLALILVVAVFIETARCIYTIRKKASK